MDCDPLCWVNLRNSNAKSRLEVYAKHERPFPCLVGSKLGVPSARLNLDARLVCGCEIRKGRYDSSLHLDNTTPRKQKN